MACLDEAVGLLIVGIAAFTQRSYERWSQPMNCTYRLAKQVELAGHSIPYRPGQPWFWPPHRRTETIHIAIAIGRWQHW
jgi:hypothetical protein